MSRDWYQRYQDVVYMLPKEAPRPAYVEWLRVRLHEAENTKFSAVLECSELRAELAKQDVTPRDEASR